jgi:CRISPR-associated protein Cas5t
VIGIRVTVPIACWRKPRAREFLESDRIPPPATAYGALLSLVGEVDRRRHVGARVTVGIFSQERQKSLVLRSLWRVKDREGPPGVGNNVRPDYQELVLRSDLLLICDSSDERSESGSTLEQRLRDAFERPKTVKRFGGWSLGESSHLVNDAWLLRGATLPETCDVFELDAEGQYTFPVWVDHVGMNYTRYVRGSLCERLDLPPKERVPVIDRR